MEVWKDNSVIRRCAVVSRVWRYFWDGDVKLQLEYTTDQCLCTPEL